MGNRVDKPRFGKLITSNVANTTPQPQRNVKQRTGLKRILSGKLIPNEKYILSDDQAGGGRTRQQFIVLEEEYNPFDDQQGENSFAPQTLMPEDEEILSDEEKVAI